jgi:hypothetical protein
MAFDFTDRDQIWIEPRNYEIPLKIIKLIQLSYKDLYLPGYTQWET